MHLVRNLLNKQPSKYVEDTASIKICYRIFFPIFFWLRISFILLEGEKLHESTEIILLLLILSGLYVIFNELHDDMQLYKNLWINNFVVRVEYAILYGVFVYYI